MPTLINLYFLFAFASLRDFVSLREAQHPNR